MIKTLQKKFIFSAMLAVTLLLAVLLGALNIGNACVQLQQNERLLDSIINDEIMKKTPDGVPERRGGLFRDQPNENTRMSAVFFTVAVNENGEAVRVDVSRIADVTQDEAVEIYSEVSGSAQGRTDGFMYKSADDVMSGGKIFVFLNVYQQSRNVLNVLLISFGAGLICWILMLLLIILLSKRAIKPIAENVERQKQFVTDAGHEIKTPLAVIRSNTEAMELYNGSNKWTENIKEQVERLDGLTRNLLTLAKADEEEIDIKKQNVSVSELTEKAVKMFEQTAEQKNVTILTDIRPDVTAKVNSRMYSNLVSILADNAVKYSVNDSVVEVKLFKKDRKACLEITNICEALPDCPPEKLFDRFYRADSSRNQKSGGYGIGLSAAKSITDAHSGVIRAEYSE